LEFQEHLNQFQSVFDFSIELSMPIRMLHTDPPSTSLIARMFYVKCFISHSLTEPGIREKGDFVDVEFYRPVLDRIGLIPDTAGYFVAARD
jgi:hypothetical protein